MFADLIASRDATASRRILDLVMQPDRTKAFSIRADGLLFDYSKTNLDLDQRQMLLDIAKQRDVILRRDAMLRGEKINETEGRAVLHTALRRDPGHVFPQGREIMEGVGETRRRMHHFTQAVREGTFLGQGGPITDVVNIGIGGSDLGPAMAVQALAPFHDGPRCHFVSNVDGAHIHDTLAPLDPQTTLVIVASKTFTTIETMTNAETARRWMEKSVNDPAKQFVALCAANERAEAFGITKDRIFGFEDWVGGRYSIWGPIGLALMLAIGGAEFDQFLRGGAAMDTHFETAPLDENMPVLLALVGIWHAQICGYPTRAILPYEQRLGRLPAYLQQLEMESNGKGVRIDGTPLTHPSCPVVWGEPGTNGQHAFFQLIHQGKDVVPCEFLITAEGHEPELAHQHRLLQANCLAQSDALMRGRSLHEARARLAGNYPDATLERQLQHRIFPGNRPSTTLCIPKLTPFSLGQIIALYEHRVFVEGTILGINSFDQWGVELGKELATALVPVMEGKATRDDLDASTRMLIAYLRGE